MPRFFAPLPKRRTLMPKILHAEPSRANLVPDARNKPKPMRITPARGNLNIDLNIVYRV